MTITKPELRQALESQPKPDALDYAAAVAALAAMGALWKRGKVGKALVGVSLATSTRSMTRRIKRQVEVRRKREALKKAVSERDLGGLADSFQDLTEAMRNGDHEAVAQMAHDLRSNFVSRDDTFRDRLRLAGFEPVPADAVRDLLSRTDMPESLREFIISEAEAGKVAGC